MVRPFWYCDQISKKVICFSQQPWSGRQGATYSSASLLEPGLVGNPYNPGFKSKPPIQTTNHGLPHPPKKKNERRSKPPVWWHQLVADRLGLPDQLLSLTAAKRCRHNDPQFNQAASDGKTTCHHVPSRASNFSGLMKSA